MNCDQKSKVLPVYQRDPAGTSSVRPDGRQGPAPQFVFRPYRKVMFLCAGTSAAVGALLLHLANLSESGGGWHILPLRAYAMMIVCFVWAAVHLRLFIRSFRRGREIVMDLAGIVLPGHGRVTWDAITEVRLCSYPFRRFGRVHLTLSDTRSICIRWPEMGCHTRVFFNALQQAYTRFQRSTVPYPFGSSSPSVSLACP